MKENTQTITIPENKRDFYYWLCENVSIRAANWWLDQRPSKNFASIYEDFKAFAIRMEAKS